MACPRLIKKIRNTQNIGDSLLILNNNFYTLDYLLCQLKLRVESLVEVRTFFYYGQTPNPQDPAGTNMRDGQTNRPSNTTIENFVNNVSELNLALSSKQYDQVNIIYQKTGYQQLESTKKVSGTATATVQDFFQQEVPWSTSTPDKYNTFSPVFIVWRLTHDGQRYRINNGYPKFMQSFDPLVSAFV